VLELSFGEIRTMTTTVPGTPAYLTVLALLPRSAGIDYLPHARTLIAHANFSAGNSEFMWHADHGQYVLARTVPLAQLPDERSAMDAVLDTSDQAAALLLALKATPPTIN